MQKAAHCCAAFRGGRLVDVEGVTRQRIALRLPESVAHGVSKGSRNEVLLVRLAKEGSDRSWLNHAAIASGVVPFFPLRRSCTIRSN